MSQGGICGLAGVLGIHNVIVILEAFVQDLVKDLFWLPMEMTSEFSFFFFFFLMAYQL